MTVLAGDSNIISIYKCDRKMEEIGVNGRCSIYRREKLLS
jgi:hypothetical protein